MKSKKTIKLGALIGILLAIVIIAIAVVNMHEVVTKISEGQKDNPEQSASGDAEATHVLAGRTFSSSTAGIGETGTLLNRTGGTVGLGETNGSQVSVTVPAGYYESITVDASGVYTKGYNDGNSVGYSSGYAAGNGLAVGTEVHIGGEYFYVIQDNVNLGTITLLSKYNLNLEGTAQSVTTEKTNCPCAFSSTNYWSNLWAEGTRLNLNNVSGFASGDCMDKAQKYARAVGGSGAEGRLLTYEEADSLRGSYPTMIYSQNYWLGSASENSNYVWRVYGDYSYFNYIYCNVPSTFGCRPVIIVSKSSVTVVGQ